jgi:small GTP-binding protein
MEGQDNITCKVVLVGDSGVGKTCIIQRYVNNNYDENTESTSASTYTYKIVDYKQFNKSISFDIWDTAGQELYRALAKNFYLNASIGILVYDIRRKESFESIKDYWYEQLKVSGEENMVFGVAGNKCDLFQEEEVKEEDAKKFAESIGAIFHLTSCKESIGIDDLFEECGKKYLEINNLIGKEGNNEKKENIVLDKKKAVNDKGSRGKKCC